MYPGFWRFAVSGYPYHVSVERSVKLDVSVYPGFWRFAVSGYPYRVSVERSVKTIHLCRLGSAQDQLEFT